MTQLLQNQGIKHVKRLTHGVNVAGKNLNLHLNAKKTKLLVAGKNPGTNHNILIDGEEVDQSSLKTFCFAPKSVKGLFKIISH